MLPSSFFGGPSGEETFEEFKHPPTNICSRCASKKLEKKKKTKKKKATEMTECPFAFHDTSVIKSVEVSGKTIILKDIAGVANPDVGERLILLIPIGVADHLLDESVESDAVAAVATCAPSTASAATVGGGGGGGGGGDGGSGEIVTNTATTAVTTGAGGVMAAKAISDESERKRKSETHTDESAGAGAGAGQHRGSDDTHPPPRKRDKMAQKK
eukprot:TRINITY_DN1881_c0_g1_i2.p1 TRINITY_DN1881_c0_g1~~TRINITY_DN1881_c0_g1_i2.p1  ORF type:complete len:214 (+),score=67.10 TRINITY_DN1881_c0_g1_i2:68-709(+)